MLDVQTGKYSYPICRTKDELFVRKDYPDDEFFIQPHGYYLKMVSRSSKSPVLEFIRQILLFLETDGDFPFDIFAAAFFLMSRYEEYLSFQPDEYGRFPHQASLAFKGKFSGYSIDQLLAGRFQNRPQAEISGSDIPFEGF